jgi:hypothetical protein
MRVKDKPDAVKIGIKLKYVGNGVPLADPILIAMNVAHQNSIRWTVFCEYTNANGVRTVGDFWGENLEFIDLPEEPKPAEPTICICSKADIWARGCKCGQMDRERKNKSSEISW